MSEISKNVFNCTIFCTSFFMKYKPIVFKQLYETISSSAQPYTKESIEAEMYKLFDEKYKEYDENIKCIKNNDEIIYSFIKNTSFPHDFINDHYDNVRNVMIWNVLQLPSIMYTEKNKNDVVVKIVDKIMERRYYVIFNLSLIHI